MVETKNLDNNLTETLTTEVDAGVTTPELCQPDESCPTAADAAMPPLDFARKLEKANALLIQNPLARPALYAILKSCLARRIDLYPLEELIQQMPEYSGVTQPPYFLIQWLLDVEALDMFELDANGADVSEERKQGLSEDEIDDLVVGFSFQTNAVGSAIVQAFNPANRLGSLLSEAPERYSTYLELLEFLSEKHSYAEVDTLLHGREILMYGRAPDERPMLSSVFIDKLAAAGGIVYNDGWQITADGKEFLQSVKAAQ
ncbi:MAG: hypothetical protein LBG97_04375 [Coriobacteriales bacterium]|jgi:hypothetical protein|nr:hypothetical protein [Coriobacteriales bacterium]